MYDKTFVMNVGTLTHRRQRWGAHLKWWAGGGVPVVVGGRYDPLTACGKATHRAKGHSHIGCEARQEQQKSREL